MSSQESCGARVPSYQALSRSWYEEEMSLVRGKSKWLCIHTHGELQHSKVCKVKEKELVEEFLAKTIEEVLQHTVSNREVSPTYTHCTSGTSCYPTVTQCVLYFQLSQNDTR